MGSNIGDMSPLEVEVRKSQYAAQIMADNDRLTERVAELETALAQKDAEIARLQVVVSDAACSLQTIAARRGFEDHDDFVANVRPYAASRAKVAREALNPPTTEESSDAAGGE